MPDLRFLPECHADTTLVLFLTNNDPRVIHAPGYPEVGVTMRKANNNITLIGFVDDDKRVPPYFDDFEIIDSGDKVILKKKLEKDQYLIIIQKAIESFLLWNADQVGIDLTNFGFPRDVKLLGNRLKSLQIEKDENFQILLAALDNQNAPGFVKIRSILNELVG
ncbi:hypothetical protein ACFP1I_03275 [Dyadobacter subterraneus]|uniref:Uncharacterized protein n=1 Tax=Dyadobacter subterraneus TaxID=2773304 RepID=A0ABR9W4N6_9BACT|nr:hypothetical protein [Dyadobacter subterraneus]MBE9460383.1 hypothetical protein [Dyadobacter subterraneus]